MIGTGLLAVPEVTKRGSFNAVSASLQQFSGGSPPPSITAVIAQGPDGALQQPTGWAIS